MSTTTSHRIRKRTGLPLFLQTVAARAYPRLVSQVRDRSWIFFDVLLAVLSVSAYVFVYRSIGAPEEYVGFVVIGGAMTAFWLNVLWGMSSQLYWEKEQGNLVIFILSPGSMMAILLGMAVGGILGASIRATCIILLGIFLFDVHFTVADPLLLLAVFTVTIVGLYGMGMMFSSLFLLLNREAYHVANLAHEPIYLLSGFYFPISSFPAWAGVAGTIIPLTLGLDAMRQLLFPSSSAVAFLSVGTELGILTGSGAFYIAGAHYALRYMERLAVQEGRLTESKR